MKKFSRCVLILIFILLLSGAAGYSYENSTIIPMYTSTTQLYVVPGTANEASVRASNGGLKDDFMIVFKSNVVIADAQKTLGTTEDIASYLTVSSPANSNIVQITCTNPDQTTAKNYVDAVAKTAVKTTTIIPVQSIQILSEGTATNVSVKPDLYKKTLIIAGAAGGVCLVLEILVVLLLSAFKKTADHSDDEFEYERYYGKYAALSTRPAGLLAPAQAEAKKTNRQDKQAKGVGGAPDSFDSDEDSDLHDILAEFDEDYAEDEDDQGVNEVVYRGKDEENEHSRFFAGRKESKSAAEHQKSPLDAAFDYVAASAEQSDRRTEEDSSTETMNEESKTTVVPEHKETAEYESEKEAETVDAVADFAMGEQEETELEDILTEDSEVAQATEPAKQEESEKPEEQAESAVHKTSQLTSSTQILGTIKK